MTAVEPRSCSASTSTARLFAGMPPPFRLTLGPVLIFAMSPPQELRSPRSTRKRGPEHSAAVLRSRLRRTYPFRAPASLAFQLSLSELCGRATRESKRRAEVELHARPLRTGEVRRPDVLALHAGRPCAVDRLDHGREILDQRLLAERRLADDGVDDGGLVHAEFHAATLCVAHGLRDIERHGPRLGVRHQTARTQHAAELADLAHQIRRRHGDVEFHPATLDPFREILGADDVRARGLRLARLVALRERDHPHGLAGAVGEHGRAAHHLIGVLGIDAHPHVQLDRRIELRLAGLLDELHALFGRVFAKAVDLLRELVVTLAVLFLWHVRPLSATRPAVSRAVHATRRWTLIVSLGADLDSHAARRALDHLHRSLDRRGVEVGQLGLRDLLHLSAGDLPDLLLVRLARAFLDPRLPADEIGGRRALRHERVRAVLEDGHDRGHDGASERGGALVVLLDELAHVDAVRAQRRADRRRGGGLARLDLHLHDCFDLLRHLIPRRGFAPSTPSHFTSFSICRKSSSTGVSRPKMDTRTLTLLRSGFTSSTTPCRSVNGPSVTRTASPFVNATLYFGASNLICRRIARTSVSVSSVGLLPLPTKLVTPGVLRTTYQESSLMTISTRT